MLIFYAILSVLLWLSGAFDSMSPYTYAGWIFVLALLIFSEHESKADKAADELKKTNKALQDRIDALEYRIERTEEDIDEYV